MGRKPGYHHTNEVKKRISITKTGVPGKNKGKVFSKEWRENLSKAHMGHVHSEEHKRKIGEKSIFRGATNPKWKGGITPKNKTIRHSIDYKLWRKSVFERDSYTCQVCREVGGYLEAHHIKSFAEHQELRFDISNGITLCKECHFLTDSSRGRFKKRIT